MVPDDAWRPPVAVDSSVSSRRMLERAGLDVVLASDITELAINRPGEYWIEAAGQWQHFAAPLLTLDACRNLARAIAVFNKQKLDLDNPISSCQLPGGERCQIVLPPVAQDGTVSMTIRKPSTARFTLGDYAASGRLKPKLVGRDDDAPNDCQLLELAEKGDFERFFELAVQYRKNIVTVGGTGSGKTTFSKALIDLYPSDRRIITIEDAHELPTPKHPNSLHLFFGPTVSAKAVLASCMRMKPDHVFVTELRGDESFDYLMALKSGHSGSVTSVHANDCRGALLKIASYIKQGEVGRTLDYADIVREVESTIDIVAYFEKTHLKEIWFEPATKRKAA